MVHNYLVEYNAAHDGSSESGANRGYWPTDTVSVVHSPVETCAYPHAEYSTSHFSTRSLPGPALEMFVMNGPAVDVHAVSDKRARTRSVFILVGYHRSAAV